MIRASLVVFAIALLAGCQKQPMSSVNIDPALATLVPADSKLVVGARLEKLRETKLYKQRFENLPLPALDKFAADTGLDPRRDVWDMLFCSNGKDNAVLMVRGKFSPTDLEPKLVRQGAARSTYKGYSLFGDERTTVFFMNASTALAGSTKTVREIIDNRDTTNNGIPPMLLPLVKELPANSQFWAVFDGVLVDMPFREDSNLGNINTMIRSLNNGWVSADLTKGLDLKAVGNCKSEDGAKQIHDALRGVIGFGRLSTPDNKPELLKAFDGMKVDQQAKTVKIVADIPQDVVDTILDTFTGSRKRGS